MTDARLKRLIGSSPVLEHMVKHGVPLTRENYIAMNWGGAAPGEWTAEHEADLPEIFRHQQ